MRCSLDKVLLDARQLANRIRATDETADMLIKQASDAHNKVIAKKQCQEEIMSFEELNQMSKTRPRSRLMMCIAAENKQLELLKQENKVLRTSLTEYETTFEMIMKKFRKHKSILKKLDQLEKGDFNASFAQQSDSSSESENHILYLCLKITELQKAIEKALIVDNKVTDDLSEIETKLLLENQELRRLIDINQEFKNELIRHESRSQTSGSGVKTNPFRPKSTQQEPLPRDNGPPAVNGGRSGKIVMANKLLAKFPRVAIVNNHNASKSKSDLLLNSSNPPFDACSAFSDDDDDHSSVASDASVKTLI